MNAPASIVTEASLLNRQLPLEDIQGLILCDYDLPAVSHFSFVLTKLKVAGDLSEHSPIIRSRLYEL